MESATYRHLCETATDTDSYVSVSGVPTNSPTRERSKSAGFADRMMAVSAKLADPTAVELSVQSQSSKCARRSRLSSEWTRQSPKGGNAWIHRGPCFRDLDKL